MKKFLSMLLLMAAAFSVAVAEEPFTLGGSFSGETRCVGWIYPEATENAIPILFTEEAENVVISHACGMSYSLKNVKRGDLIFVFSEIPEGMPNLSVSYSLPEDENEVVYTRMISRSGVDGSYIVMNDWYTEMAWTVAERLASIASDEGLLSVYSSTYEILDFISDIATLLPESMPENHYFVSTAWLEDAFAAALEEEGIQLKSENLELFLRSLSSRITSLAVSQEGVIALAASAVLQTSECMILPDIPFEPGFIVFDSGEERIIIVSVSLAGEAIVCFNASMIGREALNMLMDMEALIELLR